MSQYTYDRYGYDEYGIGRATSVGPTITAVSPTINQPGQAIDTNIIIDITEPLYGINESTVVISVEGTPAWSGDAQQPGFVVTKTPITDGFRYEINPDTDFVGSQIVDVSVTAQDNATFETTLNYVFYCTEFDAPIIKNRNPNPGQVGVLITQPIYFEVWDFSGITEGNTLIFVNNVLAYESSAPLNGFTVTKTLIANGYSYEVTSPTPFNYNAKVCVRAVVQDTLGYVGNYQWCFYAEKASQCFDGPINSFETSLLFPFALAETKLQYTEKLRKLLLDNATSTLDPLASIRRIFLQAYTLDMAPILRQVIQEPTNAEKNVVICNRTTLININKALNKSLGLLEACVYELGTIGLPRKHVQLFKKYALLEQPQTRVPFACALVCLAKALETNDLVA